MPPKRAAEPHRHVVLVVDDDDGERHALVTYLETKHIEAHEAAHGPAALTDLVRGLRPCVVVSDVDMPVMNGWEFLARVKENAELADIPVVLFSGFPADAERAAAAGVRRHLVKPLSPERIVAAIDELCSRVPAR